MMNTSSQEGGGVGLHRLLKRVNSTGYIKDNNDAIIEDRYTGGEMQTDDDEIV